MSPPVEVAGEVATTVSMLGGLIVGIFMFGKPVGIFGRPVGIGMFVGIDPQALNNSPVRIRRVNKLILIFMEPLLPYHPRSQYTSLLLRLETQDDRMFFSSV